MADSSGDTPESPEQSPEQTPAPNWASRARAWADRARYWARSWAGARTERRIGRLAKQIGAFAGSHGGSAEAYVGYIGERGARIVLVADNGGWGDLVAPTYDIAQRAVERSGVTRHERFDGEFAAKMRTGRYEWSRMAGIQIGGSANT